MKITLKRIIFPSRCLACDCSLSQDVSLCDDCQEEMAPFPSGQQRRMMGALEVFSCFPYNDMVQKMIHAMKFSRGTYWLPYLSESLSDLFEFCGINVDLIVPVPVSRKRMRLRGYNQADLLARKLSKKIGVKRVSALSRIRHTPPQGSLRGRQRHQNVEGAFQVRKESSAMIIDRRILLLDDVVTTGSTAAACAGELMTGGASGVTVLSVARSG